MPKLMNPFESVVPDILMGTSFGDTECQTAKKEIVASMLMPGSIAVSLATSCSFPSVSTWTKAHAGLSYIAADTDFLGR